MARGLQFVVDFRLLLLRWGHTSQVHRRSPSRRFYGLRQSQQSLIPWLYSLHIWYSFTASSRLGCLLLSTSRTSMAIAAFSFYDMIWRFLKPIEPLLPANKWPLFCNINTLGKSLVFLDPKLKANHDKLFGFSKISRSPLWLLS